MTRPITVLASLGILLFAAGCVGPSLHSARAPWADLSGVKTVYVQKFPPDGRGIERLISNRLDAMGYRSTYGTGDTPAEPVDAIVTYQDRWIWDMTMYMIQLNIQVRDGKTRTIVANAESFRPSLHREAPEVMVGEVLTGIFRP